MHKKNLKISKKENSATISINPEIYPIDVIYAAAYVFLDKCYVLLDGNQKQVEITLKPKREEGREGLKKLAFSFYNELLNYAFYKKQSEKNAAIRQSIVQRALITGEGDVANLQPSRKKVKFAKDRKGIAEPWKEPS